MARPKKTRKTAHRKAKAKPQERSLENPSTSLSDPDDWLYDALGGGEDTSTGVRVNRRTALGYASFWRGCSLVSAYIAKLPLHIYKRISGPAGDGKEFDREHPAWPLLRWQPNSLMTAFAFKRAIMFHALLRGNGYAHVERDGAARPLSLVPLNPESTYVEFIKAEPWVVTYIGKEPRKLRYEDVVHIKGLSFDGVCGLDMLRLAKQSLAMGIAARDYGARFFGGDATPGGVIKHPTRLSPEARSEIRRSWEQIHAGLTGAHKVAILHEGMDFTPISKSAKESQLIETRSFELRDVASWLGVPPHKVGDPNRTSYNSLESENQALLDDTLDPWAVGIEEELRAKLLTEVEKREDTHVIEFERAALVRADLQGRYAAYNVGRNGGWLSVNDIRRRENMNPIEGGDEYLVPLNMGSANKPDAAPEDAPADEVPAEDMPDDMPADDEMPDEDMRSRRVRAAIVADASRRMVKRLSQECAAAERRNDVGDWMLKARSTSSPYAADVARAVRAAHEFAGGDVEAASLATGVRWVGQFCDTVQAAESVSAAVKLLESATWQI